MQKKAPRGNLKAGVTIKRLQHMQAIKTRRSAAVIPSNASKEFEALAAHMPDIPEINARKLARRLLSPTSRQPTGRSLLFLVLKRTVFALISTTTFSHV